MATATRSQPIAGVSAGAEQTIEIVYPSIAAVGPGRLIGRICDLIPAKVNGIKLSYLLLAPLMAPFGALGYLSLKVTGDIYELTNRSLQIRRALTGRPVRKVSLSEIDNVAVAVLPGQEFYKAGDLVVLNAKGDAILTLAGVPRPERFREGILEAREARLRSDEALRAIQARQTA
jgi:hypothetical protein